MMAPVAIAVALLGLGSTSAVAAGATAPEPMIPPGRQVLVLGIDGLTFEIIDPLVAAGKLPRFKALLEHGARAVLKSEKPMRSPALWTTIATGQPRQVHHIYDFVTGSGYWPKKERRKDRTLVTSEMRRARALWNLTSAAGLKSLTVSWMNTWPAEKVHGAMVAPYVALGDGAQTTIKGRVQTGVRKQTYPPELFDDVQGLILTPDETPPKTLAKLISVPPSRSTLYQKVPVLSRYVYAARWSLASALTNTAILRQLMKSEPNWSLAMVYFDGADTLGHRFWIMRESVERVRARLQAMNLDPKLAPELKRRFGRAVDGYYEFIDGQIDAILRQAGPNTTVLVVSDHGWGGIKGDAPPHASVPFDGEHRIDGVFIGAGPGILPGKHQPLTHYDLAPTVLRLLGIAKPANMRGRVVNELLTEATATAKVVTLPADKPRPPGESGPSVAAPFADTEVERLRSLGYIE